MIYLLKLVIFHSTLNNGRVNTMDLGGIGTGTGPIGFIRFYGYFSADFWHNMLGYGEKSTSFSYMVRYPLIVIFISKNWGSRHKPHLDLKKTWRRLPRYAEPQAFFREQIRGPDVKVEACLGSLRVIAMTWYFSVTPWWFPSIFVGIFLGPNMAMKNPDFCLCWVDDVWSIESKLSAMDFRPSNMGKNHGKQLDKLLDRIGITYGFVWKWWENNQPHFDIYSNAM